jgi:hypothetical protein
LLLASLAGTRVCRYHGGYSKGCCDSRSQGDLCDAALVTIQEDYIRALIFNNLYIIIFLV